MGNNEQDESLYIFVLLQQRDVHVTVSFAYNS